MTNKNQIGALPAIVAVIVAIFVVGGGIAAYYYVQNNQTEIEDSLENDELADDYQAHLDEEENAVLDYPDLYRDYDLPEYADGELTDIGRQQTSLRDGLKITLESMVDNAITIGSYYETAMSALGYTYTPPAHPSEQLWGATFTKDDLTYQVMVTVLVDKTQIIIDFFGE
ncbi:MAG: hypothetical protein ABIE68_00060 [bacterium]